MDDLCERAELLPSLLLVLCLATDLLPGSPVESLKRGDQKRALLCLERFHAPAQALERFAQLEHELGEERRLAPDSLTSLAAIWR